MESLETVWRFTVTGLAVCRLSRVLLEEGRGEAGPAPGTGAEAASGMRFWSGRAVDLACWVGVWMSSQTAIWVTCGLAGVFVSWLAACGVSRVLLREIAGPCHAGGDETRARND